MQREAPAEAGAGAGNEHTAGLAHGSSPSGISSGSFGDGGGIQRMVLETAEEFHARVAAATTESLEALKRYLTGERELRAAL